MTGTIEPQGTDERGTSLNPGVHPQVEDPSEDAIYGGRYQDLVALKDRLLADVDALRVELKAERGDDPVAHLLGRVKGPASLREKCGRKGVPATADAAFGRIHDIVGVRVVCTFLNDVYLMRDRIARLPGVKVVCEKDYIRHVKPNGYRSYHMVVRVDGDLCAEFQLRTISQDTWAALEHQMKYKHDLTGNLALITAELKRCADELASTDLSMQTIRDMIRSSDLSGGDVRCDC
ncbi:GTP pyrophosphokinase family protein [Olsenella sp. HMSC062G07]|uniref:GTP pyrophosphokinase n=1 Tax=Olsenella sp. HMSC062G07 TaxID=1739330 RepID=UPI000A849783|nr:GTP pyrophosphokinase family protein [Olsenella sp. HMSC062G07]